MENKTGPLRGAELNTALETVQALAARAGFRRMYAFDHRGKTEEVRFAARRGLSTPKGEPIMSVDWTHACVEGDEGWTDLRTGEFCPEGDRQFRE